MIENTWVYRLNETDSTLRCVGEEDRFFKSTKFYPADFKTDIYVLIHEVRTVV